MLQSEKTMPSRLVFRDDMSLPRRDSGLRWS